VALIGLTTSVHNVHAHRGFEKAGFQFRGSTIRTASDRVI
jgi:hypothetical protein